MIRTDYIDSRQRTLKEKLSQNFYKWSKETTSHGLPNIIKGRTIFIRVMWLIFFLGSLGYCLYVVITTMIKYSQFDTSISIDITPELPAKFPAVTFCNINPFYEINTTKYLRNSNLAKNNSNFECLLDSNDYVNCILRKNLTNRELDLLQDNLRAFVANDRSIDATRQYLGYNFTDMVMFCLYDGDSCQPWTSNFQTYWDNVYGNCFTFNFNSSTSGNSYYNVSRTGPNYGLELEIAVKPPYNQPVYAYKSGLHVKIHNQSSLPSTLNNGIDIPTGFETYIGVSRTIRKRLESPYSDCQSDLTSKSNYAKVLYGYFNDLNVTYYDQEFCYTLCYQDRLIDACGCGDIVAPRIRNTDFCQTDAQVSCLYNFKKDYLNKDIGAFCESACPEQCNKIDYSLITSMANYPSESYLSFLISTNYTKNYFPQNLTNTFLLNFAKDSIVKLKINYDTLYYTEINDQEKMTFQDFLGNWGGQFGLFIGISFLSFVELIEFGIECVIIYIGHLKESRRAQNPRFRR